MLSRHSHIFVYIYNEIVDMWLIKMTKSFFDVLLFVPNYFTYMRKMAAIVDSISS